MVGCRRVLAALALLLAGAAGEAWGAQNHMAAMEVPNGGPWGTWAWPERCPEGTFGTGFSIKVTALPKAGAQQGGIPRACPGPEGSFLGLSPCPERLRPPSSRCRREGGREGGDGALRESSGCAAASGGDPLPPGSSSPTSPPAVKVEPYQGLLKDDTALNGIRLHCTGSDRGDRREAPMVESQSGL